MVNFPTGIPDCDSHSPALLIYFFVLKWLPLHWKILIMCCLKFLLTFQQTQKWDAPFHRMAYVYSRADWDGLCHHLRDGPWENIFKLCASAAASEFTLSGFMLGLMFVCVCVCVCVCVYISLIVSIRSNLTHLNGFQLLLLLQYFIEITCNNRINLLNLN